MFLSSNPTKDDYLNIMRNFFDTDGIMSDIHDSREMMKLIFDKEVREITTGKVMKWWAFIPVWLTIFLSSLIIMSSTIVRGALWLVGAVISCVYYTLALLLSLVMLSIAGGVLTLSAKPGTILNKMLLTDAKK